MFGIVWTPLKEGQQACHNKLAATTLPVPPVQSPSTRWDCSPRPEVWPGEKPGPAAQLERVLTALTLPSMEPPGPWAADGWMGAHLKALSVLRAPVGS